MALVRPSASSRRCAMQDVDQQRIAQLLTLLGEERLLALGEQFAAALRDLPTQPPAHIGEILHRLKGSAASLGFPGIAGHLAAAEIGDYQLPQLAGHADGIAPCLLAAIHEASRQR
ncbi:Hpt domain-containing protein [uncultured Erythrobacter sp.]|uniref:Hpt domain-containing protein n=1 Tax=uncultured Erythrobacter sp. TaxID=263913 RepID=UPI003749C70A